MIIYIYFFFIKTIGFSLTIIKVCKVSKGSIRYHFTTHAFRMSSWDIPIPCHNDCPMLELLHQNKDHNSFPILSCQKQYIQNNLLIAWVSSMIVPIQLFLTPLPCSNCSNSIMFAISISMADFWQKMAVYRLDCWYKKKKKKFFTEKSKG